MRQAAVEPATQHVRLARAIRPTAPAAHHHSYCTTTPVTPHAQWPLLMESAHRTALLVHSSAAQPARPAMLPAVLASA